MYSVSQLWGDALSINPLNSHNYEGRGAIFPAVDIPSSSLTHEQFHLHTLLLQGCSENPTRTSVRKCCDHHKTTQMEAL